MSMLRLSNELLLSICDFLEYCWDINSFAQTNSRLYILLNHYLYQRNIRFFDASALSWSAQNGNEALVQSILDVIDEESDQGTMENTYNDKIWEAMKLAAKHGHDRVIQLFLERGSFPFLEYEGAARSVYGPQNLLSIAVQEGHESVVRVLLKHGAGVMLWRHLSYTAQKGDLPMFKLLVEEPKYNPEVRNGSDWTPLMVAARHGRVEVVEYLLKLGENPNYRVSDNSTPISSAILGGRIEILSLLIDYGARVDPPIPAVYPICYALDIYSRRRSIEAAKYFLGYINFEKLPTDDHEKGVLLCVAAACGAQALVQRLLEHGCHPDATQLSEGAPFKESGTSTALTWATEFGHESIVRLLLEKGANPNYELQDESVLHKATSLDTTSCEAIFKLLLDYGADPTAAGSVSVLERALGSGKTALVRMLLDEEQKIPPSIIRKNDTLLKFATYGGAEMLEFLFQHGYDPPDPKDSTAHETLYSSIWRKNLPAFKFLLSKGYMPHSYRLSSTLDCAVEAGEVFLDMLLSRGADIHNRDTHFWRTCTWFTTFRKNASDLKILLDRGADPLCQDDAFSSRLQQAAFYGFAAGVEVLLKYIPTTYMKHSHTLEDVKNAVLRAKTTAVKTKKWKCVRLLHRFYYCDLPGMEADAGV